MEIKKLKKIQAETDKQMKTLKSNYETQIDRLNKRIEKEHLEYQELLGKNSSVKEQMRAMVKNQKTTGDDDMNDVKVQRATQPLRRDIKNLQNDLQIEQDKNKNFQERIRRLLAVNKPINNEDEKK